MSGAGPVVDLDQQIISNAKYRRQANANGEITHLLLIYFGYSSHVVYFASLSSISLLFTFLEMIHIVVHSDRKFEKNFTTTFISRESPGYKIKVS